MVTMSMLPRAMVWVCLTLAACAQTQRTTTMDRPDGVPVVPTLDDVRAVSPALARYTQGPLLGDLWKRPGLSPRDRSIVTLSALIARNQSVEMPYHFNLALETGVKPGEISEIITHLAFYSGWANGTSAVVIAKDVFAKRGITSNQLPPATGDLLPLEEAAEAQRAARVEESFRLGRARCRAVHLESIVPRALAAPRPGTAGSEPGDGERAHRHRSGCANPVSPEPGDGSWSDESADLRGAHAPGLLCGLAQRLLRSAGRQGRLRETAELAHQVLKPRPRASAGASGCVGR